MASSRKPPVGRGLRQPFPRSLANQLERQYGKLNQVAFNLIEQLLVPAIATNDDVAISIALDKIHDELTSQFSDAKIQQEAKAMADRVKDNHGRAFFAAVGVAVGAKILGGGKPSTSGAGLLGGSAGGGAGLPPTPGFLGFSAPSGAGRGVLGVKVSVGADLFADEFTGHNVRLIGDLRAGIREGLSDAIVRARQFGDSDPGELAERLRKIWKKNGVPSSLPTARLKKNGQPVMLNTKKHARMVAHDQISKLNADLNQVRQQEAGITSYIWTTQGDSRVRPSHQALSGQEFQWDSPPSEGHPGQPIACRCYSVAVIDKNQILASGAFVEL